MSRLHVVSGPDLGRSFELIASTIHIGRSPENEVHINDRFVSPRHLRILKRGEKFYVKDLESANGTFVDGFLIGKGAEVELAEGVPVVIGMSVLCVGDRCSEDILSLVRSMSFPSKEVVPERLKDRPGTVPKNMELLRNVSEVLTQSLELRDVLDRILESILSLFKRIDRAAVMLVDHETGEIRDAGTRSRDPQSSEEYCRDVVKQVVEKGSGMMVLGGGSNDQTGLSEDLKPSRIKSVMCAPLMNKSRVIGAIYVDSVTDEHGFRKDDLSFFKALSIPATHAIQNALLYSKLRTIPKAI